jgi:hypothetical protein
MDRDRVEMLEHLLRACQRRNRLLGRRAPKTVADELATTALRIRGELSTLRSSR